MRVVLLAAGAADMYCGSCIRDNRVAATLRAMGRDVLLFPLYTPLRTDEPTTSERQVLFGGLGVYLAHKFPALRSLARWLDSPFLLRQLGRLSGSTSPEQLGELTLAVLLGPNGPLAPELHRLIDHLRPVRPALVNLPNLMFLGAARPMREALGCPVICTLSGEDVFLDQLPEPWRTRAFDAIAAAARDADAYIAVTRYYAGHAARHFALPAERIHVVPLGIAPPPFDPPRATDPGRPFNIAYFARFAPEKGFHNLAEAFIALHAAGRRCRLHYSGYVAPAQRAYLAGVLRRLRDAGLAEHTRFGLDRDRTGKFELLADADVLCVPTEFPEPKGLYVLEALSVGTPVVLPAHGSFHELIEATGGGLLYDPADPAALPTAIARMMDDPVLRAECGRRGRAAVLANFNDRVMAEATWRLYERIVATR